VRSIAVVGLLALTACGASAQVNPPAQPQPAANVPVITATGEGRLNVAPDQVTVLLAVQTRAQTPLAAASENAERMRTVRAALTQLGLTDREVTTSRYTVHSETWRNERDTVFVAYNAVRVETTKLDLLARLIDEGLKAGATNVGALEFGLVDRTPTARQALAEAVRDARAQAEAMAAAAGGRLGDLQELSTQAGGVIPFVERRDMAVAAMQSAAPPITPGEVTVTAIVTGRWRFIPGS
jgi:uncharacterized protein YggE